MTPAKFDGILYPIQVFVFLFLFCIFAIALVTFILAKIPYTRRLIDHYLGVNFVGDHEINTTPRLLLKALAPLSAAYV